MTIGEAEKAADNGAVSAEMHLSQEGTSVQQDGVSHPEVSPSQAPVSRPVPAQTTSNLKQNKRFFETLPGILTGAAGVVTAIGGLITVLAATGICGSRLVATPAPADAPATELRVVSTIPGNGARDVAPALTEITIVFSDPVAADSYSFTDHPDLGELPDITGDPRFPDDRTCVLPVRLEPGKTYAIGVNSPTHRNFVSATDESIAAEPYQIVFSTGS